MKTVFPLQGAGRSSGAFGPVLFWGKEKLFQQLGKQECMIYHGENPQLLLLLLKELLRLSWHKVGMS